jgi:uncharacterized membrane protein YebE (DUF533 family)
MFDARNLLEMLVQGQSPAGAQRPGAGAAPPAQGGLDDLLGGLLRGNAASGGSAGSASGTKGVEDALRNLIESGGAGLRDVLGKLQAGGGPSGGGITDILGQVFGQATQGVREGARDLDQATGAGQKIRDAIGQASGGQTPEELIAKVKDLISRNQLQTGAALAGLGALILGTEGGRSMAASAAKLGALTLIGGLAYKAYQNYQQGKPLLTGASGLVAEPAPAGSGFEPQAISNDTALLCIRAMVGAAAADGRIDRAEQQKILGGLQRAGVDQEAASFLRREIEHPATADDLAGAVRSGPQAVQVFTAARLAVEPDTGEEHDYLVSLADSLRIDPKLAANIDAAARANAA